MKNESPEPNDIRDRILGYLANHANRAFRPKELAKKLDLQGYADYAQFRQELQDLIDATKVAVLKGGRVMHRKPAARRVGRLTVNPRGFGFVSIEGEPEDAFVAGNNLNTALDGDIVEVALAAKARSSNKGPEAEVVSIVERTRTTAVGSFKRWGRFGVVAPDDKRLTHDIYLTSKTEAKPGDKVVVSIDKFDNPHGSPEGTVISIIGSSDDPATRVAAVAMSLGAPGEFPEEVLRDATRIGPDFGDDGNRQDYRSLEVFTIDPVDAKDFDDAISLELLDDGTQRLGVHIADVANYVTPDTSIDKEAFERGTSIYLVDRVIPMLPEKLSNELCSLRPNEDKRCISCFMDFGSDGTINSFKVENTWIRSRYRLTYEQALAIIEGEEHPLSPTIRAAASLAQTLTSRRIENGSVDFDLPEVRVVLDEKGHPIDIVPRVRAESNRMIEEFMLAANRTVAKWCDSPSSVYRVHGPPDAERMQKLATYVAAFGFKLPTKSGSVQSVDLNRLLKEIEGNKVQPIIQQAALRAMDKARYTTDNIGHYGLGFKYYTHFTSPIRRYPDLMVHRDIKKKIAGQKRRTAKEEVEADCEHCSDRERVAVEAERASIKLKQVEYILDHLGDEFSGVVSGITRFGIYVELDRILVDGMIHVRDLKDDYYEYDEDNYAMVGTRTGTRYAVGDAIRVVVVRADIDTREIDFFIAED